MPRPASSRTIPGELALIRTIRRQASTAPASRALRLGIGDDCAILRPQPGHEICVTTDFSLEGVHFRRDWHPPESAGHRCLARGLSDLAAMGAEPMAVFLSLAVPRDLPAAWLRRFLDGFLALAAHHRVPLAGGDTAQSPSLSARRGDLIAADIVAIGQLPAGEARLRSGAHPGDLLYVTGALGGAAAELLALSRKPQAFRKITHAAPNHPHLYPEPRLAVGRRLRRFAHAMIDISDGLSTDLSHLCQASQVAAVLDETALPIHPLVAQAKRSRQIRLDMVLHGGEDYELLFAAPPSARIPGTMAGVPIHRIGTIRKAAQRQPSIMMKTPNGEDVPIAPRGWEHFRQRET
jgi:thiamine-monophosphate kinase